MLRKILFAMLAVVAFSAVASTGAYAEETLLAEWLEDGASLVSKEPVTVTTNLTLRDKETIAGSAALLCRLVMDGTVGPNGEGEITEILNAKNEAVSVGGLSGLALLGTGAASGEGSECVSVETCAAGTAASNTLVWFIGLQWRFFVYLHVAISRYLWTFFAAGAGNISIELLCLVLGINTEDTCASPGNRLEFETLNDPEMAALPAGPGGAPLMKCTQSSNKESGEVVVDELSEILLTNGKLLSVSE